MTLKLFLRDHAYLLPMFAIQIGVSILVYWLAGNQNIWIALYIVLLSACLLLLFLTYRYWRLSRFYRRVSTPMTKLDDAMQSLGDAPLATALDELLRSQYGQCQGQIHAYERRIRDHANFINQWVHGMKTPLSVIHLTIQEEDDPIFHSIREETDRLRRGLETVLYTSRLGSFEHDFHVEPVDLTSIVRAVIRENKAYMIRNRVFPEVQVDPSYRIYSDEKWLGFLLGQIVTNAIRYSDKPDSKISITGRIRGKDILLEVKDHGVGIPSQDLKRVFAPYFTGENGRVFSESTGMGLYLVRQICDRLGHRVELESQVGVGTTVRLYFSQPYTDVR